MKTHFNLSPSDYEAMREGHLGARRRELVRAALEDRGGQVRRVLEIGVGSGKLLADVAERYPEVQFIGIDVDPRMIAYAEARYRRPNLRYAQCDISRNRDQLGACDFVYSVDVVHHVRRPHEFLRSVRAVLVSNGVWLVIEPNIYHPYIFVHQERMRRAGIDEDHFRPWELEPLMTDVGFAIESRQFAFVLPGWLKSVPPLLARIERVLEGNRFLSGSIVYRLRAQ